MPWQQFFKTRKVSFENIANFIYTAHKVMPPYFKTKAFINRIRISNLKSGIKNDGKNYNILLKGDLIKEKTILSKFVQKT